jgi:uncharacterized protein (TIGR00369 family)
MEVDIVKEQQPNSKHCFVCGVENPLGLKITFYKTGPGEVTAETIISENYQGYPGVVHGGIVAAILDEVAGRALMGEDPPRFMYTAHLDVQYRDKVPTEKPIQIVGKAIKIKKRTAQAVSNIFDQNGKLLAEAKALMVDIPKELIKAEDLASEGWKVYPPKI